MSSLHILNVKEISRANFLKICGNFIALKTITRFSILGGITSSLATNLIGSTSCLGGTPENDICLCIPDGCPSGTDDDDVCNDTDPDVCPGEGHNVDKCLGTTLNPDRCNTGYADNDICNPGTEKDQCESGYDSDDVCTGAEEDNCPTDQPLVDHCPLDGGVAAGDNCAGGGSDVDTCMEDGAGDECGKGGWEWLSDSCNKESTDTCPIGDDTCNEGSEGSAGYDLCGPYDSDECSYGTPNEDVCNGTTEGKYDSCPGGGKDIDVCAKGISDDYCDQGREESDTCSALDPDDCPGGGNQVDNCMASGGDEDVCTADGGCAGGDQYGPDGDMCQSGTVSSDTCSLRSEEHTSELQSPR